MYVSLTNVSFCSFFFFFFFLFLLIRQFNLRLVHMILLRKKKVIKYSCLRLFLCHLHKRNMNLFLLLFTFCIYFSAHPGWFSSFFMYRNVQAVHQSRSTIKNETATCYQLRYSWCILSHHAPSSIRVYFFIPSITICVFICTTTSMECRVFVALVFMNTAY